MIPIVFNMCACSDGIVPSNTDLLFIKTQGWGKMDSRIRGNDSVAQELIPTGIKLSFFVSCQRKLYRLLSVERFFQGERL